MKHAWNYGEPKKEVNYFDKSHVGDEAETNTGSSGGV
jgi:hypothetical protein